MEIRLQDPMFSDCLAVIQWYQYLIEVKFTRALMSQKDEKDEHQHFLVMQNCYWFQLNGIWEHGVICIGSLEKRKTKFWNKYTLPDYLKADLYNHRDKKPNNFSYLGQLNTYLSALDKYVRKPHENPSIGIILCKEMNEKPVSFKKK